MAASAFRVYDISRANIFNGTLRSTNTYRLALFTRAATGGSNANVVTSSYFADLTGQHSTTDTGYTAGGSTLANQAWTAFSTGYFFDADDVVFTASTVGIDTKFAVIYASTSSSLLGYFDLNTASSTQSVAERARISI